MRIESVIRDFKDQSNFNLIIYINLAVFVIIKLLYVILFLFKGETINIIDFLAVPTDLKTLTYRPWTIISYMFTHDSFLHLLFNLFVFYWFGKLFLRFLSQRQLFGIYILGGIAGAILYIIAYNTIPVFALDKYYSIAIGASASIMAIVLAVSTLVPNLTVYMLFFGDVKLKYLAIAVIVLDIISIPLSNAGGHIAHLGGAILGFCFVKLYRNEKDMTLIVSRPVNWVKKLFRPKETITISYKNPKSQRVSDVDYRLRKKAEQDEIDKILEKISKSGYSSLNKTEKETLFKMSNRKGNENN